MRKGGLERAIARAAALDGIGVRVGVVGEPAARAAAHEFGIGVPLRPFLRQTAAASGKGWGRELVEAARNEIRNQGSVDRALYVAGEQMVKDVQEEIRAADFAPLAPATVERKGHTTPLVDSGNMAAAVKAKVAR